MTSLAVVASDGGPRLLLRQDDHLYDLAALAHAAAEPSDVSAGDVGDFFRRGGLEALSSMLPHVADLEPLTTPEDELTFLPPVMHPGKVLCVGLNYRLHAAEGGVAVPSRPVLFAKFPNALIGHRSAIVHHRVTAELDYEGELAVIIGRQTRGADEANALRAVGAYTILNDVSARDLQAAEPQWIRAKSLDTFAPIGPYAALATTGFDPASYRIRTTVSGDLRQDASCGDMVFSVAEIVAFVSEAITLEPGDIISTGTPPGVGLGFNPPRYLSPGDTVRVEIDGIGALVNHVVAA